MKTTIRFQVGSIVAGALGAALFLSACSGGTGSAASPALQSKPSAPASQSAAPGASGAATGGEIKVTLDDRKFPKEIRVKADTKVVFVITNLGKVEHTFEFPDFGVKTKIKSGETGRLEWTVPDKKGKWDMGCFLTEEGFHELMEGTLFIE